MSMVARRSLPVRCSQRRSGSSKESSYPMRPAEQHEPLAARNVVHPLAAIAAESVMSRSSRVLLINPTITKARSARFPLAILSLSAAMEGRTGTQIVDGNVDRDFVATAVRACREGGVQAVGVSVMGGPQ